VWCWRPLTPISHFDGTVPVVGFEIESSWRSRKHVKGDFLNLQDSGVALGVIVLAGSGEKDDLRRFAHALVDRPGTKVLIWTDDDVRALSEGKPAAELPINVIEEAGEDKPPSPWINRARWCPPPIAAEPHRKIPSSLGMARASGWPSDLRDLQ